MENLSFNFKIPGERTEGKRTVCGVVGSGNLEVIVEDNTSLETIFAIQTSVPHFAVVWQKVIEDFVKEYQPIGLQFTLNDNGATPPVVSLRLRQAMELFKGYQTSVNNYLELGARERINAICDKNSFTEWLADEKLYSPHLNELGIPGEADDGIIIGKAKLNGNEVLIAAQQKDFMGGGVGEIHGAKLTGLFLAAAKRKVAAVILLIDSGGVRLHEANAGEISISEAIRAIFAAREAGVMTIGVICGKNGAYGGMGIISSCLDYLIINESGRTGVSGAEVIQAVKGIDTLDAQNRALVWRIYGGKTRYLQQVAQSYVDSDIPGLREEIINNLNQKRPINLATIKQKHKLLKKRMTSTLGMREEEDVIAKKLPKVGEKLFEMNRKDFLKAVKEMKSAPKDKS